MKSSILLRILGVLKILLIVTVIMGNLLGGSGSVRADWRISQEDNPLEFQNKAASDYSKRVNLIKIKIMSFSCSDFQILRKRL